MSKLLSSSYFPGYWSLGILMYQSPEKINQNIFRFVMNPLYYSHTVIHLWSCLEHNSFLSFIFPWVLQRMYKIGMVHESWTYKCLLLFSRGWQHMAIGEWDSLCLCQNCNNCWWYVSIGACIQIIFLPLFSRVLFIRSIALWNKKITLDFYIWTGLKTKQKKTTQLPFLVLSCCVFVLSWCWRYLM